MERKICPKCGEEYKWTIRGIQEHSVACIFDKKDKEGNYKYKTPFWMKHSHSCEGFVKRNRKQ